MRGAAWGEKGYSLLELLLTVSLIALGGSIAALSLPSLLEGERLKLAGAQISSAVVEARAQALLSGQPWRLMLDADGQGFALERAAGGVEPGSGCAPTGWERVRHQPLAQGVAASWSRPCLTFTASGRPVEPKAIIAGTVPAGGAEALLRLADRQALDPKQPGLDPLGSPRSVSWPPGAPVELTLDLQQERELSSICVGLLSWPSRPDGPITYPKRLTLYGALDSGSSPTWSLLSSQPGPADTPGGHLERTCHGVEAPGSHRYLRLELEPHSGQLVLDEVELGGLSVRLEGSRWTRRLVILPGSGQIAWE